jgi:hypothetical protein
MLTGTAAGKGRAGATSPAIRGARDAQLTSLAEPARAYPPKRIVLRSGSDVSPTNDKNRSAARRGRHHGAERSGGSQGSTTPSRTVTMPCSKK